MKRILSLDGGGIRGMFSLEILSRIEALLRERTGRSDLVLADYFHFLGGTSTGAIIAAGLSWGYSVAQLQEFYRLQCAAVFGRKTFFDRPWTTYHADELSRRLQRMFSEDGEGREPALLGSKRLRTLLLMVMRNGSTGAPWPITNNPKAKYNQPELADCNLHIPLWQLLRASSAAPVYFPPEEIDLAARRDIFIDGGISPYNNPSWLMALTATAPAYRIEWATGPDKLLLISVGTARRRVQFAKQQAGKINLWDQSKHVVGALIDSGVLHQDLYCRLMGHCLAGEPIDSEVGAVLGDQASSAWPKLFSYVRYNHEFQPAELEKLPDANQVFQLDNVKMMPFWQETGAAYALANVTNAHLL